MNKYDLIIFDCDGTLMDTEALYNTVTSEVLTEYGLEGYTPEKCLNDFNGRSWQKIKEIIDEENNIDLPQSVIQNYIDRSNERIENDLDLVTGVYDFLVWANDNFKICIGSNGERGNVTKSVTLTGIDSFFQEENTFTKIQVANAKPAPDLFLFAAEKMRCDPAKCLVLEDSVSGAKAGVAAGMDVFGFTGVAHDKKAADSALKEVGTLQNFDDFIHIRQVLEA
ncbi:MAG: HAD family phosphatase [Pseudomonadota bacterium]